MDTKGIRRKEKRSRSSVLGLIFAVYCRVDLLLGEWIDRSGDVNKMLGGRFNCHDLLVNIGLPRWHQRTRKGSVGEERRIREHGV